MKIPLSYQTTEFDCGTVSLINSMSYIYNREEIPAEIIHAINNYTLDNFGISGRECEGGTSRFALSLLNHWLEQYAKLKEFPLKTKLLIGDEATFLSDKAKKCVKNGGCIMASVWLQVAHYIIITDIDEEYVYIFDPYYMEKGSEDKDKEVEMIFDKPFNFNRKVSLKRFLSKTKKDYSLMVENEYQELLIMERE